MAKYQIRYSYFNEIQKHGRDPRSPVLIHTLVDADSKVQAVEQLKADMQELTLTIYEVLEMPATVEEEA